MFSQLESNSKFGLVFLPALSELEGINGKEYIYSGCYDLYRREITALYQSISDEWLSREDPKKVDEIHLEPPKESLAAGYFPDFVFELGMSLGAGAVGAGLFNLLRLWVDKVNGRKLRIRLPSGLEVEATQLSIKEFRELLTEFSEIYDPSLENKRHWKQMDGEAGEFAGKKVGEENLLSVTEATSEKKMLERKYIEIREAISESRDEDTGGDN